MPRIAVSPLAQADIDDIWDHIARDSLVNADALSTGSNGGLHCWPIIPVWASHATILDPAYAGFATPAT